jgi:biotin transporter BioY
VTDVLGLFIGYPWLAAVIGLLFAVLGWQRRRWGVVTIGVIWGLYAVYETGMQQRWLCTGECNIRVDLLLIYPILLLLSAGAALSLWRTRRANRPGSPS